MLILFFNGISFFLKKCTVRLLNSAGALHPFLTTVCTGGRGRKMTYWLKTQVA